MAKGRDKAQQRKTGMTRRRVLAAVGVVTLAAPAGAVAALRLQDSPLPRVAEPRLVYADGWLLDESDLSDMASAK